ncbi:Glycosyltransferase involved in cell wall bisynthesis [Chryseolinea serpens]|uniref:Glycosyltransferase involved in cell wall bisynthesis n=1 Tax=Chryseolinea serpens TaxID=947013 RepID=A0A1M5NRD5_9BACT|nr:glycosyltransferase family 2 protein [Chryseolinea serpens]SHG92164.1 Glycosyltransferase involved in cell wall bisynthesis [Chryseolinea serpens]
MTNTDSAGTSNNPRVTIVTVAFNAVASIEQTIQSVLNLTYDNLEYVIIDGGSTDGTVEIIKRYASQIDFWISERDRGIYDGMNKGVRKATGEWINFMNCGDRFLDEAALNFFNGQTFDADLLYGDALIQYPGFQTLYVKTPLNSMWKRMPFCHQATFTRTALMRQFPFDLEYKLSSDFDFIYKMYLANRRFREVHRVICLFDFTEGASIKHVFRSGTERKQIVLAHSFSIVKWAYHTLAIGYIYLTVYFKKLGGPRLTAFLTRLLRQKDASAGGQ